MKDTESVEAALREERLNSEMLRERLAEAEADRRYAAEALRRTAERVAEAEKERERLRALLDRDHTGLASALNAIRRTAAGYRWIPAGELGSYSAAGCGEGEELTEEVLRREVGWCLDQIQKTAVTALGESGTRAGAAFIPELDKLSAAESRATAAEERVRELEMALEPLADMQLFSEHYAIGAITADQVRAARRALGRPE